MSGGRRMMVTMTDQPKQTPVEWLLDRIAEDRAAAGSARMRAEAAAKDALVAAINTLDDDIDIPMMIGIRLDTDPLWCALALPYADRSGYDEHWGDGDAADEPAKAVTAIDFDPGRSTRALGAAFERALSDLGPSPMVVLWREFAQGLQRPIEREPLSCYDASWGRVHVQPSCRCPR